jgi:hypothetical protein
MTPSASGSAQPVYPCKYASQRAWDMFVSFMFSKKKRDVF